MSVYRKKPVEIEARQFVYDTAADVDDLVAWCNPSVARWSSTGPCIEIHTLEGVMRADPGDWIIRGVKGEFYPCKPDVFEATYEPAAAPHREDGEGDALDTLRTVVGKLWEWHRANYKLAFPITPKEWSDLERILDSAVPVLCAQPPTSDTDRAASREDELAEEIAIWRKVAAFYRCCALSGEQPEDGGIIDRFRRMETDREEGTE